MIYTLEEIKEIIVPIAKKYPLATVYLFGSYARGEADEFSDLDFAIEPLHTSEMIEHYFPFLQELEDAFQKEIDLIFLENVYESATRFENRFAPRFEKERVKLL